MKQLKKFINRVEAEYDRLGDAKWGPLAFGAVLGGGVIMIMDVTADSIELYNIGTITLSQMGVKVAVITTYWLTAIGIAYIVGASIIKRARQKEKAQEEEKTSAT